MIIRAKVGKENQLTRGRDYVVIGFSYKYYRILNDRGEPTLYPCRAFDTIEGEVPKDWVWYFGTEDDSYADPVELSDRGFYERYFDHDDDAIRTFNDYIKKLGIKGCK